MTRQSSGNSAPDDATMLFRLWQTWNPKQVPSTTSQIAVASVAAMHQGWLAVVEHHSVLRVVAHVTTQPSAIVDQLPLLERQVAFEHSAGTSVALLLSAIKSGSGFELTPDNSQIQCALQQVNRWIDTQHLHDLAGGAARTLSPAQTRALATLAAQLRNLIAVRRTPLAARAADVEQQILGARGVESERQIDAWVQTAPSLSVDVWLRTFPRIATDRKSERVEHGGRSARVIALLLLQPRPQPVGSLE